MSILLIVLASSLTAPGPDKDQGLAALQGTWKLLRQHVLTTDIPDIKSEWVIKGKTLTETVTMTGRGTIRLDPTRSPGRCEKTSAAAPGFKEEGIYSLKGDTFRTCFTYSRRLKPPTDFPDKPDPGYIMDVWERREGGKKDSLEGKWFLIDRATATVHQGKEDLKDFTMTVKGDEYFIRNHQVRHGTITLDSTAMPKQIDVLYTDSTLKGKINRSVYQLDGSRLTVAGSILLKRPTKIPDNTEDHGLFEVFEKVEP